jgi:membrane protease YdiL (CAAX protease family)
MSFTAALGPLVAYAATFQTIVFLALPSRVRAAWAPVAIGTAGAGVTLAAGLIFGFEAIGVGSVDPGLLVIWSFGTSIFVSGIAIVMIRNARLRTCLADPRMARLGRAKAFAHIALRIPVMTALIEEAFFRGVLHAALTAAYPPSVAVVLGAGLFGVWHIGPALDQAQANRYRGNSAAIFVLVTIVATTIAGLGFVGLRVATGSIRLPVVVHAVLNMTMASFSRLACRGIPVQPAGYSPPD